MNIKRALISILLSAFTATGINAADFFSTDKPDSFMNLGLRVGFNTSNVTTSKKAFNAYNLSSWGIGFEAGIVADLNIREYISIQPGFFYESRSGNFVYRQTGNQGTEDYQPGHYRTYNFTVPIVASMHFNLADNVRWDVDFGPYVSFHLNRAGDTFSYVYFKPDGTQTASIGKRAAADFGFKMGTGFQVFDHYYIGAHYYAGALHAWKGPFLHGHNKIWAFTVGYDF